MPTGADQTESLKQDHDEFPSNGLRILTKAAKTGKEDVIRALLDMGVHSEPSMEKMKVSPHCMRLLIEGISTV